METTKTTTQILGCDYKKCWGKKTESQRKTQKAEDFMKLLAIDKFLLLTRSFYSIFLVQDR